jgi:putative hemolysin
VAVITASNGDLIVRLARKPRDVASAQALRYRVFYREMGACANLRNKVWRRDIDRFDRACDHLLVIDRGRRKMPPAIFGQVVGTWRLIRRAVADRQGGFYSEGEFDLGPVLAQPGECLELGRSCVDPDYRSRAVIDHLWSGTPTTCRATASA